MHHRFLALAPALLSIGLSLLLGCVPAVSDPETDSQVCSAYEEMCPSDEGAAWGDGDKGFADASTCNAACTLENINANPTEMCAFMFCAVEVGLCDNEESGDAQIEACGASYGWW